MPSSLGYPFPPVGGSSHHPTGALSSLASSTVAVLLSTAIFPWNCFLRWLSWCSGLAVRSVTTLGAPPPKGFIPASKLQELNSIVNHMHTREDLYRRAIRELQEELDAKDTDRKKALKKLRATKEEIALLSDQLAELQSVYEGTSNGGGGHGGSSSELAVVGSSFLVHGTMLATSTAVWWFSQVDHAALHWKLVFSFFFPLLWLYVSRITGGGGGNRGGPPLLLLASAWFLGGFAIALTLNSC